MNKTIATIAFAGSLAVSLSAFAGKGAAYHANNGDNLDWATGWYIGAGVNGNAQSTMNLHGEPEVFDHYLAGMDKVDQSSGDLGFDVYVGREVSKHWAAELGYTYVGQQTFHGKVADVREYDVHVNQWNVHLVGVGKLPIGEYFNVFAKGGAAYFSTNQEFKQLSDGSKVEDTSHTMALTYGAGIEVTWDNWGIRGEYNVIWPANNVRDDFYIADVISANLYYKFM